MLEATPAQVSITGLPKAEVLAALYNASRPMGMSFLQARPGDMTVEQAQAHPDADSTPDYPGKKCGQYFDYLHGRPLKINLDTDDLHTFGFDRDNGGPGSAARIIATLRSKLKIAARTHQFYV